MANEYLKKLKNNFERAQAMNAEKERKRQLELIDEIKEAISIAVSKGEAETRTMTIKQKDFARVRDWQIHQGLEMSYSRSNNWSTDDFDFFVRFSGWGKK